MDPEREYDKAIADSREAIRLDPKDANAFSNRGRLWCYTRDYDKAIADCGEAIRRDPKHANAFAIRGLALAAKKQYGEAIFDFDEAIALKPDNASAYVNRSVTQMILRFGEAVAGFKTVVDLEGGQGEHSTYAVILGHFAARLVRDQPEATAFLDGALAG